MRFVFFSLFCLARKSGVGIVGIQAGFILLPQVFLDDMEKALYDNSVGTQA